MKAQITRFSQAAACAVQGRAGSQSVFSGIVQATNTVADFPSTPMFIPMIQSQPQKRVGKTHPKKSKGWKLEDDTL